MSSLVAASLQHAALISNHSTNQLLMLGDQSRSLSIVGRVYRSLKIGSSDLLQRLQALFAALLSSPYLVYQSLTQVAHLIKGLLGAKDYSLPGLVWRQIHPFHKTSPSSPSFIASSSYERHPRRMLTTQERRALLPYACLTAATHAHSQRWVDNYGIKLCDLEDVLDESELKAAAEAGFELCSGSLVDWKMGTKLQLFEGLDTYYLLFGDGSASTKLHESKSSPLSPVGAPAVAAIFFQTIQEAFGSLSPTFLKTSKLTQLIQSKLKTPIQVTQPERKPLQLVGQCWGGLLASFCGLDGDIPAICINAVGMGSGLQTYLGDKLLKAGHLVTHIFVDGDWTQNMGAVNLLDRSISLLGFKTPGSFGRKFLIPSAYSSIYERHTFFLGSLMSSLDFEKRDVPFQIAANRLSELLPPADITITKIQ